MSWTQKVAPNLNAQDQAGWCLRFTQRVFHGSPVTYYPSARSAWDNSGFKHSEMPPNAAVPIFFSWRGDLGDGQGVIDWGHAAAWIPGRGVLSSPGSGYGQRWFSSVQECARYFGASYLGWCEDVGGFRVVDWVADPPAPEPSPGSSIVVDPWPAQNSTLWGIAETVYGDGSRWPEIYNLNAATIGADPNLIHPGMVLNY